MQPPPRSELNLSHSNDEYPEDLNNDTLRYRSTACRHAAISQLVENRASVPCCDKLILEFLWVILRRSQSHTSAVLGPSVTSPRRLQTVMDWMRPLTISLISLSINHLR